MQIIIKRLLAAGVAVVLCLPAAPPPTVQAEAKKQPNIIFFLVDDMSADLLPYMDTVRSLGKNGTRFDSYYVANSLCCPSRASMLTGEYPHNNGVLTNVKSDHGGYAYFEKHEGRTYAPALHKAGYRTGYLGKYLNGYPMQAGYKVPAGWDEWHVANGGGYNEFRYQLSGYVREKGGKPLSDGDGKYLVDVLGDRAASFIKNSRENAPGKPFFLQVAPFSPHGRVPFKPGQKEPRFPPAHRDRPGGDYPNGDCGGKDCQKIDVTELPAFNEKTANKPSWVRGKALTDTEINELRTNFRDRIRMVQAVDDMVARVMSTLTPAERANTYIAFTSDNGFHLGQHRLLRGKESAYDHDIRVPLLIKRPEGSRGGDRVVNNLTQNVDLYATFLDLARAGRDTRDGFSLAPLIDGKKVSHWRQGALVEHVRPAAGTEAADPDAEETQKNGNSNPPTYTALRTAGELLVRYDDGTLEFYDTAKDPNELTNKPTDPRAKRLEPRLLKLSSCGQSGKPSCATASR